jgi:hypothetical protein
MIVDNARYFNPSLKRDSAGEGFDVVSAGPDLPPVRLNSRLASILDLCCSPNTIDERTDFVCAAMGVSQPHRATIRDAIVALAEKKLLTREADFYTEAAGTLEEDPPPIAKVCLVTRNRPHVLRRAVLSQLRNTRRYDHALEIVVFDDSDSLSVRNETKAWLRSLNEPSISYAGFEERASFADALAADGLPERLVRFALLGEEGAACRTGANRNAILLGCIPGLVMSYDDDILPDQAIIGSSATGLAFLGTGFDMELWPYPSRRVWWETLERSNPDMVTIHRRLLGKGLRKCLREVLDRQGSITLRQLPTRILSQAIMGGYGTVQLTVNGIVGDCGFGSPNGLLCLDGDSRDRLVRDEASFRSACISREVMFAPASPTITDSMQFRSGSFALDLRDLLPPFFPVQRNSDGAFGVLLRWCIPEAFIGLLPCASVHLPPEERCYQDDDVWRCSASFRMSELLVLCILSCSRGVPGAHRSDRLRSLGSHLTAMADCTPGQFQLRLHALRSKETEGLIARYEHILRKYSRSPGYWAETVDKYLGCLRETIRDPGCVRPQDLAEDSPGEGISRARDYVAEYGRLLCWWPEIVERARHLSLAGYHLARAV